MRLGSDETASSPLMLTSCSPRWKKEELISAIFTGRMTYSWSLSHTSSLDTFKLDKLNTTVLDGSCDVRLSLEKKSVVDTLSPKVGRRSCWKGSFPLCLTLLCLMNRRSMLLDPSSTFLFSSTLIVATVPLVELVRRVTFMTPSLNSALATTWDYVGRNK